jgi:hypothetical protein
LLEAALEIEHRTFSVQFHVFETPAAAQRNEDVDDLLNRGWNRRDS